MIKINRPPCPDPTALCTDYKHTKNKAALIAASCGKCMYCESQITHVYFGDVEHIKPKDSYPHLKFDWQNLGFVCAKCNNAKSNNFDDSTPYINPYDEEPSSHIIAWGHLLRQKMGSERGALTIVDIDLNRVELLEKRKARVDAVEKSIDACCRTKNPSLKAIALRALKDEGQSDKEYSIFIRALLHSHGIV